MVCGTVATAVLNVDLHVSWKIHIHGISDYFLSYIMRSSNPTTLLRSTCEILEDEKGAALGFWDPIFFTPSCSSCYLQGYWKLLNRCDFAIKRNREILRKIAWGGGVREGWKVPGTRPTWPPRNAFVCVTLQQFFFPHQIPYSDASPFLILSEASLADLNSRLEKKVKTANFRPNIVISGCGVYAEVTLCLPCSFPWT